MPRKPLLVALVVAIPILVFAGWELFGNSQGGSVGDFESGLTAWKAGGGGAQCANYGTPSTNGHLRGDLTLDHTIVGQGTTSGRFDLPADPAPSTYPLEACDLVTGSQPLQLGSDDYYGLMLYVPQGWTIANNSFWGAIIAEYHFVNVWGAPVTLELHPDHLTLALETGSCNPVTSGSPGCQYRSNADHPCTSTSSYTCLPGYTAIPRGALVQGKWNEIIMHVHWASDSSGQIQTWYRVKGSPTWTQSTNITGYPTVQWNSSTGCCTSSYVDLNAAAYTAALSAPLTLWLDNSITGPTYNSIATTMP